jgi:hypothetical protein
VRHISQTRGPDAARVIAWPAEDKEQPMHTKNQPMVTTVFVSAACLTIIAILLHNVSSVLFLAGAFWLLKVGLDNDLP